MQLEVITQSEIIGELGKPVLIPIPRKRDFHWMTAYIALALEHKADIIRVHDVAVACDLARLFGRGQPVT
jgi:dihydropteroate synthase